jgi:serine/threonine protein kinase/tetratricopeptide (TPR) repeat protein
MTTWNPHANKLFLKALELHSPAERQQYLDRTCAGDAALRAEVDGLLEAIGQAGSFLEAPAADLTVTADAPLSERPGAVIGPYKLLEQLGEGGFGVVFLAEQTRPLRRRVALKVLKPGMDTRQIVARFEAERQALALMDHPNIAHILDGGQTPSGRPYFVMELVKGVPITDYCDENRLSLRARLERFTNVCQAVQHAHQKGIIHRDLKPSNVLVTTHDATSVVKVIDFGVAKALSQPLTDRTVYTGLAQMIGTPQYMSPEQAGLSGLDVDTRSDIYSLGVLLYKLLTGTTPLEREQLQATSPDEMRRIIREEEPARPSTRISTLGPRADAISSDRQSDPRRLSQQIRGELDWIVMKALEKDRSRRYESASAFAADVQRYLNDEPVQACPPSPGYRFRKFAHRNLAALTVAAVVALVLGLATAISVWQAVRATQAEGLAEERLSEERAALRQVTHEQVEKDKALRRVSQEKARADHNLAQARKAVKAFLTEAGRDRRLKEADLHALRRKLLESALPFYQEFVKQEQGDPQLEAERGDAYGDLAVLYEDLGDLARALAAHQKRRAIFEGLAAKFPAKPAYRHGLSQSYRNIGNVYNRNNDSARAESAFRQALSLLEALSGPEYPAFPPYRQDLAGVYNNLGILLRNVGRLDEALPIQQKAVDLFEQLVAEFPKDAEYHRHLAASESNLAVLLSALGHHEDALAAMQRSENLLQELAEAFPRTPEYRQSWATALNNQSVLLGKLGRRREGLAVQQQALAIQEKLAADFSSLPGYRHDVAISHVNLSVSLMELNRNPEALAACDRAVGILKQLVPHGPRDFPAYRHSLALAYNNRGEVLHKLARSEEAIDAFKKALAIETKLVADFRSVPRYRQDLAMSCVNLGELLTILRRLDEADAAYARALPIREKLARDFPADRSYAVELAGCYAGMGNVVRVRGEPEAALDWYARALARLEPVLADEPRLALARRFASTAHAARAVALLKLDRFAEALQDLDRALALDDGQRREELRRLRAATQARVQEPGPAATGQARP